MILNGPIKLEWRKKKKLLKKVNHSLEKYLDMTLNKE
jgi:hypothetical protein